MAAIVVMGAGIGGSAAALVLARDGHAVIVVDRDPGPLPPDVDAAWESWNRRGVSQFRMAHLLLQRGASLLTEMLPDVLPRLEEVGGLRFNQIRTYLPNADLGPEDERFETVTGRRTTIEWVLATMLAAEPRVTVRRGAAVRGLVVGPNAADGTPHVAGVRLDDGQEVLADVVIDATGRNSPTMRWLAELGGRAPIETSEDSGFAYYGRFFRSSDGSVPEFLAPTLTPFGSMSILTIPSDNGTWSTTLYASSHDKPLRRFRDPEVFEAVVRASPLHAHWVDGEPIGDIQLMVGVADRTRSFVREGEPIVTGLLPIGDAAACTNPSIGRGMTFALMHTRLMRDVVREHLDRPRDLAAEFGRRTEIELMPWHEETRQIDRARASQMRAIAEGGDVEPTPQQQVVDAVTAAAGVDLTVARAMSEVSGCLTPANEVFGREGFIEHALGVAATAAPAPAGPDRARLLELVS